MKKLLIVLLALAVIGVFAFAQDEAPAGPATTIGGSFWWGGNWVSGGGFAKPIQTRFGINSKIDKFNTVDIKFRGEGGTWGSYTTPAVKLHIAQLTTDITGALGMELPVTVKLTSGYFDTYFTNWGHADDSGWAFYYSGTGSGWSNGLVNAGQNASGAYQFDIGAGPLNIHYYNDLKFNDLMLGADGAFGPVSFWASYGAFGLNADSANISKGSLSLEGKYALEAGDIKVALYPYFRYALGAKGNLAAAGDWTGGIGAGVDYTMFHVALGAAADNFSKAATTGLSHVVAKLAANPVAGAEVGGIAYMAMASSNPLTGIDLYGSYKFGAAQLRAGYVVGGTDKTGLPMDGDNYNVVSGLYATIKVSF